MSLVMNLPERGVKNGKVECIACRKRVLESNTKTREFRAFGNPWPICFDCMTLPDLPKTFRPDRYTEVLELLQNEEGAAAKHAKHLLESCQALQGPGPSLAINRWEAAQSAAIERQLLSRLCSGLIRQRERHPHREPEVRYAAVTMSLLSSPDHEVDKRAVETVKVLNETILKVKRQREDEQREQSKMHDLG